MPGAVSIIERLVRLSKELPFADREFFGLASQKAMETLGQLPQERKLRWRMDDSGVIAPRTINPNGSQLTATMHLFFS
ncbi:hypothetical protein GX50_03354 [[Emmonsia] crescens]|uniref:Uncharacterized protein n=1 Tax=[Emmonsia] crescens TaxID=73230 RepID=A0A2B7ZJI0_9EURO|nr:hypothetical protein GX50_03354 [Emmonsia crescens]